MAALRNVRYEYFAQALASGKSPAEAYTGAGFKGKYPAKLASDLRKRPDIAGRVDEIVGQVRSANESITKTALATAQYDATRVVMEVAETIQQCEEVARRCMQHSPVLDDDGNPVMVETKNGKLAVAYTFNAAGANQALGNKLKGLHLLGIDVGRFVNRHQLVRSPLDGLSPELVRQLEQALSIALEQKPGLQRLPVTIEGEQPGPERSVVDATGSSEGAPGGGSAPHS